MRRANAALRHWFQTIGSDFARFVA